MSTLAFRTSSPDEKSCPCRSARESRSRWFTRPLVVLQDRRGAAGSGAALRLFIGDDLSAGLSRVGSHGRLGVVRMEQKAMWPDAMIRGVAYADREMKRRVTSSKHGFNLAVVEPPSCCPNGEVRVKRQYRDFRERAPRTCTETDVWDGSIKDSLRGAQRVCTLHERAQPAEPGVWIHCLAGICQLPETQFREVKGCLLAARRPGQPLRLEFSLIAWPGLGGGAMGNRIRRLARRCDAGPEGELSKGEL